VGERQDANNAGRAFERVTIREAATLLGVHPFEFVGASLEVAALHSP
jgi:hypothetical protein